MSKEDQVNHPKHYNSHPSGVECKDVTRHMSFDAGNAVKYLWRNGLKDGNPVLQELKKSRFYIIDEAKRVSEISAKRIKDAHEFKNFEGIACDTITDHMTENIAAVVKSMWASGLYGFEPSEEDFIAALHHINREISSIENLTTKND